MRDDLAPLHGRRIVITREREQSRELAERLAALGAEVVSFPMVRFLEALDADRAAMDKAVGALGEFDWVIFTSANAVAFFLRRREELREKLGRREPQAWPAIATVGPATRAALEGRGLRATFMPREFRGAALAAELAGELAGKNVLLPRSDRAGAELPAALRAAGARVTEVVVYRTVNGTGTPEPPVTAASAMAAATKINDAQAGDSDEAEIAARIRRGEADAIAFFSPSAFRNFERMFGGTALREMSTRMVFAAVGPVTAAAMREAGVPRVMEAQQATAEAVADALAGALGVRRAREKGTKALKSLKGKKGSEVSEREKGKLAS